MPEVVGWTAHCLLQEQVEGNGSLLLSPLLGYSGLVHPAAAADGDISVVLPIMLESHPYSSLCSGKSPGCSGADAAGRWDACSAVAVVWAGWGEAPTLLSRSRSSALPCRSRSPGVFGLDTFTTR